PAAAAKQAGLVEEIPEPARSDDMLGADAVEKIVAEDDAEPDDGNDPARQMDEPGQDDHRGAYDPNHLKHEDSVIEVEPPGEAHQRELDQNEPKSARQQEPPELLRAATAPAVEMGRHAGEQNEGWGTEVRDPACQENGRLGDIARVHAAGGEEITRVIERHQHHDEPTQQIDRVDAATRDLSGLRQ